MYYPEYIDYKKENKMKNFIKGYWFPIIIVILVILMSVFSFLIGECVIFDPGLPEGYRLICSTEGTIHKYGIASDNFGVLEKVFDTQRGAKEWAYNFDSMIKSISKVPGQYNWNTCPDK